MCWQVQDKHDQRKNDPKIHENRRYLPDIYRKPLFLIVHKREEEKLKPLGYSVGQ